MIFKYKKLQIILVAAMAVSCTQDIEIEQGQEPELFPYLDSGPFVKIPQGLVDAEKAGLTESKAYTDFTMYSKYLSVNAYGVKSDTTFYRRPDDTVGKNRYQVQVYSDYQHDYYSLSRCVQVTETDTHYIFELFWKQEEGFDYIRKLYATESKDTLANGFMEVYLEHTGHLWGFPNYRMKFEWSEEATGRSIFKYTVPFEKGITSLHHPAKLVGLPIYEEELISNPNNSGSWVIKRLGKIRLRAHWDSTRTQGTYGQYYFVYRDCQETGWSNAGNIEEAWP